jgi:hypothetical protein
MLAAALYKGHGIIFMSLIHHSGFQILYHGRQYQLALHTLAVLQTQLLTAGAKMYSVS